MMSSTIFYRRHLWCNGVLKLDSQYKYAADKDLILRIASYGAVIGHIPEYLSIFGIDGTNLSTHPQMKQEVEKIRLAFGAFRCIAFRKILMLGRSIERFLIGGYRRSSITYSYAIDEVPHYLEVKATYLGGRYNLWDTGEQTANARFVDKF